MQSIRHESLKNITSKSRNQTANDCSSLIRWIFVEVAEEFRKKGQGGVTVA